MSLTPDVPEISTSTSDPPLTHADTPADTPAERLLTIASHMSIPAPKKPAVTCHVLDTSTGKPAPNIPCTLSRFLRLTDGTPSSSCFEVARAFTNADGRVAAWEMRQKGTAGRLDVEEGSTYKIRFDTWEHFGGETFFPYVEVVFTVKEAGEGAHYHIPLLLSPYSYSTYRGS
ncbi:hypothetical protein Q9L58_006438 [Maublancomyces gigas]|uniref:hydroxyisourate hydrolase n=1 Tax=Discina gigas TaxID=1032678 RepID=A0ABR3GFQ7_9PEZI